MAELQEGMPAPPFTLPAADGSEISLASFKGRKQVVLYFYPKDNTPGCTAQACSFRDHLAEIEAHGAVVLGVSRDSVRSHERFIAKFGLPFHLLADEGGNVCTRYGVLKEKNMYGRKVVGIERSTFLIGKDGKIKRIFRKVKVDGHTDEVLAALGS